MSETVQNRVRELRMNAGLTQKALGQKLDVTRKTILAMEKGSYNPSVGLAMKIAKFFKQPVEKIFFIQERERAR